MKPQEIFNTVAKHLFDQGKRSTDKQFCRYHNEDGLKCAVGVLIEDDVYFPEMDSGNKTIKTLVDHHPDKFPDWVKENLGLLQSLQSVHDKQHNWETEDNMINALIEVASVYEVSPDVLDDLQFKEEETENDE